MMLLADLYQKLGRQSQALDTYLKILERDPLQTTAREEGAWIQVQQDFLDSALDLLEVPAPQTPHRTLILAHQQMTQENWSEALRLLREVETRNPLHPGLLQLIGYCLNAHGQTDEALAQLAKAASLRPEDPDIRLQIREIKYAGALGLLNQGRFRMALTGFEELLKEDVQPEFLLRMAYSRQQLGDLSADAAPCTRDQGDLALNQPYFAHAFFRRPSVCGMLRNVDGYGHHRVYWRHCRPTR